MVKILFDSEYGIEEIGIGYAQISEEYWNNLINKLPMNLKETFPEARYLIPRMLSHSYKRAKNTAKLRNAIFSDKRMPAFNPHNIDKDNPFKFNKETPGASDVTQLRQMLIENYKEDMPEKPVPLLNILITALAECNIITPGYSKKGINAEAIEIKPNVRDSIRICQKCYRPRLTPVEFTRQMWFMWFRGFTDTKVSGSQKVC